MLPPPFEKPDVVILSHQRSGTHLLSSALGSHPTIYRRGECVTRYKRLCSDPAATAELWERYRGRFCNVPGRLGLAIVMYPMVPRFEALCGPLSTFKIIHLLRNPHNVARSFARMIDAKRRLGAAYRGHYRLAEGETAEPMDELKELSAIAARVEALQQSFQQTLASYPAVLTVRYEDLTGDREVNAIPPAAAERLLKFLGLPSRPLTSSLRKTLPISTAGA